MSLLGFIVAMVALELWLITILVTYRERGEPEHQETTAQDSPGSGDHDQPVEPLAPTHDDQRHRNEEYHRRQERRYWRLSLFIGAVAMAGATGAVIAAYFAYEQTVRQTDAAQRQARAAEDNLVADHRPYVFATISDDGAIERWADGGFPGQPDPGWPNNHETIIIANYGRGPAIIDSAECQIVLSLEEHDMRPSLPGPSFTPPVNIAQARSVMGENSSPIQGSCPVQPWRVGHPLNRELGPAKDLSILNNEHRRRVEWLSDGFWVLVNIHYRDAFDNTFGTTVCAKYDGSRGFSYVGGAECNKRT